MSTNDNEPSEAECSLSQIQQQAVLLMASGKTNVQVARTVGVTKVTVSRWLARPDFRRAREEALQDVRSAAMQKLQAQALQAVTVIARALRKEVGGEKGAINNVSPVALKAAEGVLDRLGMVAPKLETPKDLEGLSEGEVVDRLLATLAGTAEGRAKMLAAANTNSEAGEAAAE